jgi:hypothetical protein
LGKPDFWVELQVETLLINTAFLVHNFSFRTGAVQEEETHYELFRRSFSLLSKFF